MCKTRRRYEREWIIINELSRTPVARANKLYDPFAATLYGVGFYSNAFEISNLCRKRLVYGYRRRVPLHFRPPTRVRDAIDATQLPLTGHTRCVQKVTGNFFISRIRRVNVSFLLCRHTRPWSMIESSAVFLFSVTFWTHLVYDASFVSFKHVELRDVYIIA